MGLSPDRPLASTTSARATLQQHQQVLSPDRPLASARGTLQQHQHVSSPGGPQPVRRFSTSPSPVRVLPPSAHQPRSFLGHSGGRASTPTASLPRTPTSLPRTPGGSAAFPPARPIGGSAN